MGEFFLQMIDFIFIYCFEQKYICWSLVNSEIMLTLLVFAYKTLSSLVSIILPTHFYYKINY